MDRLFGRAKEKQQPATLDDCIASVSYTCYQYGSLKVWHCSFGVLFLTNLCWVS